MDVFTDPLIAGAPLIYLVRWAVTIICLYNMYWGLPGVVFLFKGTNFPLSVFRAGVGLTALASVGLNFNVIMGGESGIDSAMGLAFFTVLFAGHLCLAYARVSGVERKIAKFFALYPAIEKAVAIAELEQLSPVDADKIHRQTRKLIVDNLLDQSSIARADEGKPAGEGE